MKEPTEADVRLSARPTCTLNQNNATCGASATSDEFLREVQLPVSKDSKASEVLTRFAPRIRWTVDAVMNAFDLPNHYRDEVHQEALILVTSYADLLDTEIWGHGQLASWTAQAKGDETQIKALLARILRMNLSQIVARQINRDGEAKHMSTDEMADYGIEPSDNGREELMTVEHIDNDREMDRAHRLYPEFAMQTLDAMTIAEIMEATGKSRATVFRHIESQKEAFLADQERYRLIGLIQDAGLRTEGDETLDELTEAVSNLKASGRA